MDQSTAPPPPPPPSSAPPPPSKPPASAWKPRVKPPQPPKYVVEALKKLREAEDDSNLDGYNGPRFWNEIAPQSVVIGAIIANGTFGSIQKGEYEQQSVALKMMNSKYIGSYDYSVFYNEICILGKLQHSNIIKMIGANTQKGSTYFIALEYISGGDLFNYLEKHGHELTWRNIFTIALGIAKGMKYMHEQGILFRDLKSSNILLRDDLTPVITDFGMALKSELSATTKNEATGTPLWMSPEVYMKEKFTTKADIYSFGIILTELVSGVPPFHEREDEDWEILLKEVVVKGLRPSIPEFCPDELRELITRCTHASISERPSFDEVIVALETASTSIENFPVRNLSKREPREQVQQDVQSNNTVVSQQIKSGLGSAAPANKDTKKRAEKMHLLHHILKCQNAANEWEWSKAPFAAIGTDAQVARAKLRNFLRTVGMFVSEEGPRCDVWSTCVVYSFLDLIVKSLNKQTTAVSRVVEKLGGVDIAREEETTTNELELVTTVLQNLGKENWRKDTEQAINVGYNRFFVGLDPQKRAFTTWETQLLPLATEFVEQYTLVKQLL